MRARLASHRFRRRLLWVGSLVAAGTGVAVTVALIGNTAKPEPERFTNAKVWVYREPKLARLTSAERQRLLDTSLHFVRTAVARKHLDEAWALAGPELRQGMSRREWLTGDIPVVPFPAVGVAQWDVAYSYENDVAFQISLVAKPGTSSVVGKTFTIELTRPRAGRAWRVAAWAPLGISGPGNDVEIAAQEQANEAAKVSAPLAMWWLALPVGVLALVLLIPLSLAVRSWLLHRRFEREYRAERGLPPRR